MLEHLLSKRQVLCEDEDDSLGLVDSEPVQAGQQAVTETPMDTTEDEPTFVLPNIHNESSLLDPIPPVIQREWSCL